MIDMPILDAQTGAQYVLSENTTEITGDMAEHISVSPDDNTTLIYGSGIAEEDVPQVGDIIFAKVSDNFPDGFLGKVSSIKENGDGSYTVETGIASLSEAFDELYVNETVTLTPLEEVPSRAEGNSLAFNIELTTGIKGTYKTKGAPFYASGGAELGSKISTYISIDKKNKIDRINLTFINSFTMEGELGMSGTFPSAEEAGEASIPLGEIKFKNIPLAYGVIQITPVVIPSFVAKIKGTAENKVGFKTKIMHISGAEYVNGQWDSGAKKDPNGGDNNSPWKFEGGENSSLTFKGNLFTGFDFNLDARMYNRKDMKIGIGAEAGINLEGKLEINHGNSQSLEQILSDAKLITSVGINTSCKIDASLIMPGDLEIERKLLELKLWEREVPLLPFMKKPEATVTPKEETETTSEQAYTADMTSELQGPTLMKDIEVSYVLENEDTGEIEDVSEPIAYSGDMEGEIYEGEMPQDVTEPVEVKFDNLKEDATYKIYPVITSPTLENIAEENKVELEEHAVSFDTSKEMSERELLIEFYKATDGDNWTNNENWCSDKPLDEWYGIGIQYTTGHVVSINLPSCGLTGIADLRGLTHLSDIDVSNNALTVLDVSGLSNLFRLLCSNNQLTKLNTLGTNAVVLECNDNQLTNLDTSTFTNLETLFCRRNQLQSLKVSHLASLRSLDCAENQITNLDAANLANLTHLDCAENQITNLDVSNSVNLTTLNCNNNQVTNLATSDLINLNTLYCHDNQLTIIDVSNSKKILSLGCRNNPLLSITVPVDFHAIMYTSWGEHNPNKYQYPSHENGYQYPEFIYK